MVRITALNNLSQVKEAGIDLLKIFGLDASKYYNTNGRPFTVEEQKLVEALSAEFAKISTVLDPRRYRSAPQALEQERSELLREYVAAFDLLTKTLSNGTSLTGYVGYLQSKPGEEPELRRLLHRHLTEKAIVSKWALRFSPAPEDEDDQEDYIRGVTYAELYAAVNRNLREATRNNELLQELVQRYRKSEAATAEDAGSLVNELMGTIQELAEAQERVELEERSGSAVRKLEGKLAELEGRVNEFQMEFDILSHGIKSTSGEDPIETILQMNTSSDNSTVWYALSQYLLYKESKKEQRDFGKVEYAKWGLFKALSSAEEIAERVISLGGVLHKVSAYDLAEAAFKEVIKQQPNNSEALAMLGITMFTSAAEQGAVGEKIDEAKDYFRRASEQKDKSIELILSYGEQLLAEQRFDLAEILFYKLQEGNPQNLAAWNNLAIAINNSNSGREFGRQEYYKYCLYQATGAI